MKEVTTRANKLMHPKDAEIGKMLCFADKEVGEIKVIDRTPKGAFQKVTMYYIEWSSGILSTQHESLEMLVRNLEGKVKFYHL